MVSEWDKISSFDNLKKFLYLAASKRFLVYTLHLMLDGLILFRKGDFCRVRKFLSWFSKAVFLARRTSLLMQTLLKQYYPT